MRTRLRIGPALLACGALCSSGCSVINAYEDPPIVKDWQGSKFTRDRMTIDLEGDGEASINFFDPGGLEQRNEYEIRWEQTDEREYELAHECTATTVATGCGGFDFDSECDINSGGDELECRAQGNLWADPVFLWEED